MRSRQRQLSNPQSSVPPVPTTLWHRLPTSSHVPLAHLVAELIQRVRIAAKDKECDHEH
jgi:hypothetical protein